MVIDSSAIEAILFDEPERDLFTQLIEDAGSRLVSAVNRVETAFVVEGRKGFAGRERLDRFFRLTGAEIVSATPEQAEAAVEAFRRFGRGRRRCSWGRVGGKRHFSRRWRLTTGLTSGRSISSYSPATTPDASSANGRPQWRQCTGRWSS